MHAAHIWDKRPMQHAIKLWLVEETIMVEYPDGQQIPLPLAEINRLATILRSQANKAKPVENLLAFRRREFQAAFSHPDIVAKGQEIRKRHDDELTKTALRKEKEKELRLKRIKKRVEREEAEKLLALVGL